HPPRRAGGRHDRVPPPLRICREPRPALRGRHAHDDRNSPRLTRRSHKAMSPLKRSNNIAARMGRWSASHWKTAVFGWLAFVVLAVFIGMQVGTKTLGTDDSSVGQSHKADQILKKAFPQVDPQTELVLVQSSTKTVDDPKFRATVNDVIGTVETNPAIKNLKSPLDSGNSDKVSKDRRSVIVTWDMKGKYDQPKTKIDAIESSIGNVGDRHPGFYVGEAGSVSSGKALDKMVADQLK